MITLYELVIEHMKELPGKTIYCSKIITDNRPSFYKIKKDRLKYACYLLHVGYSSDDYKEFLSELDFSIEGTWANGAIWWDDMSYSSLEQNTAWPGGKFSYHGTPEIPTGLWRDTDKEERKEWRNSGQRG